VFVLALPSFANINPVMPTKTINLPKLEFLENYEGKNQITLLNNRFRVDYHVEEVLLLFFRKNGSKPIVLVQPDGSKIYDRDSNGKTIEWHADMGFDLIRLKNPMPGPWQAVGRILENSKILLLSDIELQADTFPSVLFQHEIIKAEARIVNANEMINAKNFSEVIKLRANLYPSKDSAKENFGADIYQFGEFLDDGKGLDEKPRDGVFTIRYKIEISKGEWTPNYRIDAKLFTRELAQEPVLVLTSPISFTAIPATMTENGEMGRYHYVTFEADDTYLDNLSLLFQGTIQFPNGDKQTFSIDGLEDRRLEIFNVDFGAYNIDMDVFGTTKDGREINLDLPTFQFITTEDEMAATPIDFPEIPDMTEMPAMPKTSSDFNIPKSPKSELPMSWIIFINILILLSGFAAIWVFVLKREIKNPFAGLIEKLLGFFKKGKKKAVDDDPIETVEPEKPKEKPPVVDGPDDILDLSLPED
jgi:uncharacterized protein (TIGR03503 family)